MNKNSEKTALKLEKIVKTYGEKDLCVQALKGIDLSFRKNEFVSILGPSGCGKTTLLNIIGGLDRYTSGDLIIEGKSTKNYTDKDWDAYRNNSIGFVFQTYNLIPHQTVLGNVELALELSGVKKSERKERAIKMLEKVGLKDQIRKKPNQLSGGQMQRVAIARALINDPEIILADEPTGALDTETSVAIMNLLKEIAKDKLVIMVTHNPELAKDYSTRIIRLLDGLVVDDSNPFEGEKEKGNPPLKRKPKMGFKTAIYLSVKNLISKRTRTILTAIAGSIGIIGVALVLALSNGFSAYMYRMQTDSLASYPITISESSIDLSSFSKTQGERITQKYKELDNVFVKQAFNRLTNMLVSNDLKNQAILDTINGMDNSYYYDIAYDYGFDMNDYLFTDLQYKDSDYNGSYFWAIDTLVNKIESKYNARLQSAMGLSTSFVRQYIPTIEEMPNSAELLNLQYDIIKSEEGVTFESVLESENQMFLVVDEYNSISDITLALLGFLGVEITEDNGNVNVDFIGEREIPYENIVGKEIYFANNDTVYGSDVYQRMLFGSTTTYSMREEVTDYSSSKEDMTKLEIVGIIRPKKNVEGILNTGFAYSPKLTQKAINENKNSQIVTDAKSNVIQYFGTSIENVISVDGSMMTVASLCGMDTPSEISIYAKDFASKEKIKEYFDKWNAEQTDEEMKITYSDMMSMLFSALTTMVDAVTYILIAFTSISLVVSSVMIGIITYVSVVERTKEIGVLRSLGASKREISRVFNAEAFLIGLFAGLIGITVTYLLCIPINIVIGIAVSEVGTIAVLNPITALCLVVISFALTMIAGLIPAKIAAKKDPVVALRSE